MWVQPTKGELIHHGFWQRLNESLNHFWLKKHLTTKTTLLIFMKEFHLNFALGPKSLIGSANIVNIAYIP
jgi:hypothetical protein